VAALLSLLQSAVYYNPNKMIFVEIEGLLFNLPGIRLFLPAAGKPDARRTPGGREMRTMLTINNWLTSTGGNDAFEKVFYPCQPGSAGYIVGGSAGRPVACQVGAGKLADEFQSQPVDCRSR
jgi:hypothetical protein